MANANIIRTLGTTVALVSVFGLGGCDLLDSLESSSTIVNVFGAHQASTEDGIIPNRGGNGEVRKFENEEGWSITLVEGLVVTKTISLQRCDGTAIDVDLYNGSIAEDLRTADLDAFTLGGTEVSPTELCGMTVRYGPFDPAEDLLMGAADLDMVAGNSLILRGVASRGDQEVLFEMRSSKRLVAQVDLSTLDNGNPLRVTGDEPFPVGLTLTKTYDRFFDGVDFGDLASFDLETHALAVLELETTVAFQ